MEKTAANDNFIDITNKPESIEAFTFWHKLTDDAVLSTKLSIIETVAVNPSKSDKKLLNRMIDAYMPRESTA